MVVLLRADERPFPHNLFARVKCEPLREKGYLLHRVTYPSSRKLQAFLRAQEGPVYTVGEEEPDPAFRRSLVEGAAERLLALLGEEACRLRLLLCDREGACRELVARCLRRVNTLTVATDQVEEYRAFAEEHFLQTGALFAVSPWAEAERALGQSGGAVLVLNPLREEVRAPGCIALGGGGGISVEPAECAGLPLDWVWALCRDGQVEPAYLFCDEWEVSAKRRISLGELAEYVRRQCVPARAETAGGGRGR